MSEQQFMEMLFGKLPDPKPSTQDMRVGDRFGVPIFTITRWGMFMYDPNTKRVTKIQQSRLVERFQVESDSPINLRQII